MSGTTQPATKRQISRYETAFLLVIFDFLTIASISFVLGVFSGIPPEDRFDYLTYAGTGLIAIRSVVLLGFTGQLQSLVGMCRVIPAHARSRIDAAFQLESPDSTSQSFLEECSAISLAEREKGRRRCSDKQRAFAVLVGIGTIGLAAVALMTGGPLASPFAVLLLAVFTLGQVRAPTPRGLWLLFRAAVGLFLLLYAAEAALKSMSQTFDVRAGLPTEAAVLPLALVALITSYVNAQTLFEPKNAPTVPEGAPDGSHG